ncbi:ig family protein [Stylonychia lemnae]|uniref:Ig family protein n=1 Tax=Stylonychia lemnae TaxID=5949 RepID=A0A078A0K5_STYLE|nr:ig family protein [Stylonychia lemnae]|eukprot:CDW75736.1 ig family protein [Stylonychia lemnae]
MRLPQNVDIYYMMVLLLFIKGDQCFANPYPRLPNSTAYDLKIFNAIMLDEYRLILCGTLKSRSTNNELPKANKNHLIIVNQFDRFNDYTILFGYQKDEDDQGFLKADFANDIFKYIQIKYGTKIVTFIDIVVQRDYKVYAFGKVLVSGLNQPAFIGFNASTNQVTYLDKNTQQYGGLVFANPISKYNCFNLTTEPFTYTSYKDYNVNKLKPIPAQPITEFIYFIGQGEMLFYTHNYTVTSKNCLDLWPQMSAKLKNGSALPAFFTYPNANVKNNFKISTNSVSNAGSYPITLYYNQTLGPIITFDITIIIKVNTVAPQFVTNLVDQDVNVPSNTDYTFPNIVDQDGNTFYLEFVQVLPNFITFSNTSSGYSINIKPTDNSQADTYAPSDIDVDGNPYQLDLKTILPVFITYVLVTILPSFAKFNETNMTFSFNVQNSMQHGTSNLQNITACLSCTHQYQLPIPIDLDGDQVYISILGALPNFVKYFSDNTSFEIQPDQSTSLDQYQIMIKLSDSILESTYSFYIQVKINNEAPKFMSFLADFTMFAIDQRYYQLPNILDIDSDTYYMALTLPSFVSYVNVSNQLYIDPNSPSFKGTYQIKIQLSDYYLSQNYSFKLIVLYDSGPPIFESALLNQTINPGDIKTYALPTITDPDLDTFQIEIISSLPLFITFDSALKEFHINSESTTSAGEYSIKLQLKDQYDKLNPYQFYVIVNTLSTEQYVATIDDQNDEIQITLKLTRLNNNASSISPRLIIYNTTTQMTEIDPQSVNDTGMYLVLVTLKEKNTFEKLYQTYEFRLLIEESSSVTDLVQNNQTANTTSNSTSVTNITDLDSTAQQNSKNKISKSKVQKLTAIIQKVTSTGQIMIQFNDEIANINKTYKEIKELKYIDVKLKNQSNSIQYTWNITLIDEDRIVIQIIFNTTQMIGFTKVLSFISYLSIGKYTDIIQRKLVPIIDKQGGTLSMLYQLINALQLIVLVPLNSFTLPGFLSAYFQGFNSLNFQLFNLSDYLMEVIDIPTTQNSKGANYDDQGFQTQNILINNFDSFMMIVQLLALYGISYAGAKYIKFPRLNKPLTDMRDQFKYNAVIRYAIETYIIVLLCTNMNIELLNTNTTSEAISSSIAVILMSIYVVTPIGITAFVMINYKKITSDNPDVKQKYGSIFEEFRQNKLAMLFYPIFMLRRLITAWAVIGMSDYPLMQSLVQTYSSLVAGQQYPYLRQ